MRKKITRSQFILLARQVHGWKYDYSKVDFSNVKRIYRDKVCIICPKHGEFWQTPGRHLSGCGCKLCYNERLSQELTWTTETYIEKAKQVHAGQNLDYSKTVYTGSRSKIKVICKKHGEFSQLAGVHLRGNGCPRCIEEKSQEEQSKGNENFIKDAQTVHGRVYDYSKVNYVNNYTKVKIICPKHGEFSMLPKNHLKGQGCPKCKSSKLETELRVALENNNINFEQEKSLKYLTGNSTNRHSQRIDFLVSKAKLCIECQGEQHFCKGTYSFRLSEEDFLRLISRDVFKYESLSNMGYETIYFTEKRFSKYCKNGWYADKKVFYDVNSIVRYVKEKESKERKENNTVVCCYDGQLELKFNECEA